MSNSLFVTQKKNKVTSRENLVVHQICHLDFFRHMSLIQSSFIMPLKVSFEFPSSLVSFFIGGGQNADPQSMDHPHGLPIWTTLTVP